MDKRHTSGSSGKRRGSVAARSKVDDDDYRSTGATSQAPRTNRSISVNTQFAALAINTRDAGNYTTASTQHVSSDHLRPPASAMAGQAGPSNTPEPVSSRNYDLTNYIVKPRKFFESIGRVIVVMWSEPARDGLASAFVISPKGAHGGVLQKPRFFIVIRAMEQHCLAISINTHLNTGAVNMRFKAAHGIAYHQPQDAIPLPGEEGMQPVPIRILPDSNTETLAPRSRINYSKIYTIEYNIGVRPFGMVQRDHFPSLVAQFQAVTGFTRNNDMPAAVPAAASATTSTVPGVQFSASSTAGQWSSRQYAPAAAQLAQQPVPQPHRQGRARVPTETEVLATIARLVAEGGMTREGAAAAVMSRLESQGITIEQIRAANASGATAATPPATPLASAPQAHPGIAQRRALYERLVQNGQTKQDAVISMQRHFQAQGLRLMTLAEIQELVGGNIDVEDRQDSEDDEDEEEEESREEQNDGDEDAEEEEEGGEEDEEGDE